MVPSWANTKSRSPRSSQSDDRTSRWLAPKRYADTHTSDIEVTISKPVDDLKIELTWDGGAPFVERR